MTNQMIKLLVWLIIILIFLYAFSNSYQSRAIDNLSYVVAIGIDLAENKKDLKITFEFSNISIYSKENSSSDSSPILETVTASSIDTAINMLNVYVAKQVNLAHCKVIILSEKLASRGIFTELSELMNNPEFRPSVNIIVSNEEPYNYLKNSSSSLDKILTKYYDIFPSSSKYTGYISNITIGEFYDSIINNDSGNITILGGINKKSVDEINPNKIIAGNSSIEGDRGTENIGLAVFNKDKYIGNLTAQESLYFSIIQNNVNSFLITIDAPNKKDKKIDISTVQVNPPKISVDLSGKNPIINIDLTFSGKITSIIQNLDFTDEQILSTISNDFANYMNKSLNDYLIKTSTNFKSDINDFYKYAKCNFLTIKDWKDYDWYSKYKNAKFNINTKCNVVSGFVVSER